MRPTRSHIAMLTLSAAAFVGILTREGYTEKAIIPTKGDVPTVGFGTTGGVKITDTTTPVKAVQRALLDASSFEGALKKCVTAPLSQAEYDIYVDMSYNIGPTAFCKSSMVKNINAQKYYEACDAILLYKYAAKYDCSTPGNTRCYGVWIDRQRSHAQCVSAQ